MRHPKFLAQVTKRQVFVSAGQQYEIDRQSLRAVAWDMAGAFPALGLAGPPFEQLLVSRSSVQLRLCGAVHGRFLLLGKVEDTPKRLGG